MEIEKARVIRKEVFSKEIFGFDIEAKTIARKAKPGQFLQLRVNNLFDPFLRRPFSIASVKSDNIRIIFRVRGKGTEILSQAKEGEYFDILGPLGRALPQFEDRDILLIGGGVGIAPLFFLCQKLEVENRIHLFLGAKNYDELIMLDGFKKMTKNIIVSTEDGSSGKRGKVTDLLTEEEIEAKIRMPIIFTCGPLPMLKVIEKRFTVLPVFGFLEERMGCGTGICFGCAVQKKNGGYLRVCKDGPVLNLHEIEI
jgi:dihydroorotate dehydrogenase electron transfer subunit